MATGVRIRVTWDGTVIEDRVHVRDHVLIGSGKWAHVVAPGPEERYVVVTIRGRVIELRVAPGVIDRVEFPGEPPVEGATLVEPLVRRMAPPYGAARIEVGGATVEIERWSRPASSDAALWAYTAAACVLALLMGSSYPLIRLFGDGTRTQWGRPPSINDRDASHMRVRIGPDGLGAARPQAGLGAALRGRPKGPENKKPPVAKIDRERQPKRIAGRPKVVADSGTRPAWTGRDGNSNVTKTPTDEKKPPTGPEPTREKVIEDAQAALLAADLRKAIDSFSSAQQKAPLDYDQLNWLGLAHYLAGEYDDATGEWQKARGFDEARPDAINNLASVAKRRGDIEAEMQLLKLALTREPHDCHASNSMALALAKSKRMAEAETTLQSSDGWCGGGYAYTSIQRAALRALQGKRDQAFVELEEGLKRVDTMIPVKEFEVLADLRLDPAFESLRSDARFDALVRKYLPRAIGIIEQQQAEHAQADSDSDSDEGDDSTL